MEAKPYKPVEEQSIIKVESRESSEYILPILDSAEGAVVSRDAEQMNTAVHNLEEAMDFANKKEHFFDRANLNRMHNLMTDLLEKLGDQKTSNLVIFNEFAQMHFHS